MGTAWHVRSPVGTVCFLFCSFFFLWGPRCCRCEFMAGLGLGHLQTSDYLNVTASRYLLSSTLDTDPANRSVGESEAADCWGARLRRR
jgi:hypothetical protein